MHRAQYEPRFKPCYFALELVTLTGDFVLRSVADLPA